MDVIRQALKFDPNARAIIDEERELSKKVNEEKELEKSLYRRMLGLQPGVPTNEIEPDRYPTLRGVSFDWLNLYDRKNCYQYLFISYQQRSFKLLGMIFFSLLVALFGMKLLYETYYD